MKFVEGMIAGLTFGMIVGIMKSDEIEKMYNKGKKYVKKIKNYCLV